MPRTKMLRVLLNDAEYGRLKQYAESNDMQISEVIRDYIKQLPIPKDANRNSPAANLTV